MNHPLPRLSLFAIAMALLVLASCNPKPHGSPQNIPGKSTPLPKSLQFKKVAVGLPSKYLGVVGKDDYGIAGAGDADQVFYAVKGEKGYEIHTTDLASGQSRKITELADMLSRTLTSDPQGKRLLYTKLRTSGSYIDNPAITEPAQVAVIASYDLKTNQETNVFDFKEEPWLRYRSVGLAPMLSNSGKRVATLTFDIDRDMLMRDLDEWLSLAPDFISGKGGTDREKNEKRLHDILALPHIYPKLKGAGIEVADDAKFTQGHIDAVRKLRQSQLQPQWAVLVSDAGADPKLIELKLPAKYALNPVTLMTIGDEAIILATQGKSTGGYPEAQLLRVDEATGNATELTTYLGAPQTVILDSSEEHLLISYLSYDNTTKILSDKLTLRTVPLDDPAKATQALLYPAVPDAFATTNDPKTFAVQSAIDHAIYFSKSGSSPEPIAELLSPVDGMFLTSDASHLVYAENGLLFSVDVQPGGEAAKEWVPESTFSAHETAAAEFLKQLGYEVPADVTYKWEEREGLGSHEITGLAVKKGQDADGGALLRYNAKDERFESLFFPGTPWPNTTLATASVDAPEAEKRAEQMRTAAGWLSDKATKYQPGANPLYDGQTGTYVLIFHDGYLIDTPQGQKEAVNGEVSVRVHKPTGQVVEMNLQTMPEVKTAKFKVSDEEIKSAVRNKGRQKYPENAAIRIDTDAATLIVARDKKQRWAPAEIEELGDWRLAWAVDTFIVPEEELILTTWVDVETSDVLGELYFMPTSQSRQGL